MNCEPAIRCGGWCCEEKSILVANCYLFIVDVSNQNTTEAFNSNISQILFHVELIDCGRMRSFSSVQGMQ